MQFVIQSNAYLERSRGSLKREVAGRVIFFGETHLRRVVDEYLDHYHRERNHQGLDGQIIEPGYEVGRTNGKIRDRTASAAKTIAAENLSEQRPRFRQPQGVEVWFDQN